MTTKHSKFTVRQLFYLTTFAAIYLALVTALPTRGLDMLVLATPFAVVLMKRWLPMPQLLLTISLVVVLLWLLLPDIQ